MKILAIIINIFSPGIGTFFVGKYVQAFFQTILTMVAYFFMFTGVGIIIGFPIFVVSWLWAMISTATAKN